MILIDTNVLIYAFGEKTLYHRWGRNTLRDAILGEGAAVNTIIATELMVGEESPDTLISRLEALGLHLLDLPILAAERAATAYAEYLINRRENQALPSSPKTPLPDFLIGSHASVLGFPLATVDTTRYQTYFPEVKLIRPSAV